VASQVFCTAGDLEIAVGGADVLRQLADPQRNGAPDAARVTDSIERGAAELRSATEVKHDPETLKALDTDSLRLLRDINAALSAECAYINGGRGHAMPPWVLERSGWARGMLDRLARGERRLGRVDGGTAAPINQPVGIVNFDPGGTGISIDAFKRGFR
jgi:hypothetical protein